MEIAIITETLFKENGPIQDNTEISNFVPYIVLAQKMYIRPLIGRPLLKQIQNAIKANIDDGTPIPGNLQALILEIAPCLSFYAVYQGLPMQWAKIQNKGLTIMKSENSDAVGGDDLARLRSWLRVDAQSWGVALLEYLKGCRSDFPTWEPPADCGCEDNTGAPLPNFGISIPKRR